MEEEIEGRISGLEKQLALTQDRQNTIIRVNRAARTAIEVFDEVLEKERLDPKDLHLILNKIKVFEDRLEVSLKPDIDSLLHCGTLPDGLADANDENMSREEQSTFDYGMEDSLQLTVAQESNRFPGKVFHANVVSDGDPLEIFTSNDGEVIFKKYSPMGELSNFAGQLCETMHKTTNQIAVITDRDSIISVSGAPRRELSEKRISGELSEVMEGRQAYCRQEGDKALPVAEGVSEYSVAIAVPILSEGDVMGCVVFLNGNGSAPAGEVENKLALTVAGFLGKQMES